MPTSEAGDPSVARPRANAGHGQVALGVDVGGTKLATVLLRSSGELVAHHRSHIDPRAPAAEVIAEVVRHAREELTSAPELIERVGAGIAAQVRRATGEVVFAPNLDWREVPFGRLLGEALDREVRVLNDVRASAFAELSLGAGVGVDDFVMLQIGTGVGGGIVSGGRLLEGDSNTAGEIGHLTIVAGGRPCPCGGRGCLEAYVSGNAIAARAREAYQDEPSRGAGLRAAAGGTDRIDAKSVAKAFHLHDKVAVEMVEETADYLAAGLTSVVNALNPQLLVLGGGVIDGIPELVPLAEQRVRKLALSAATPHLRVVRSTLGELAGAMGAASYALRPTRRD